MEFTPDVSETRVSPQVQVQRDRKLPQPGDVAVTVGSRVEAADAVARAYPPRLRRALSLTRMLGVREADVPRRLLKHVGDTVEAREVIIAKPINLGLQRLVYRAPGAGRITCIQGSWMVLDQFGEPLDLPALYRGTVVNVTPRRGARVQAFGALIQAAWGSGKENLGVLKLMVKRPDQVLNAEPLELDVRGALLVAGAGVTAEALRRAESLRASGVITGSLDPALYATALELQLPVVVTEGFGHTPMSAPVFELLSSLNGQEAAVSGVFEQWGPEARRPEIFVPLIGPRAPRTPFQPAETAPAASGPWNSDYLEVKPGARVRGLCAPNLGRIGTLPDELRLEWWVAESGQRLPAVQVQWQAGPTRQQVVPWANLELIG